MNKYFYVLCLFFVISIKTSWASNRTWHITVNKTREMSCHGYSEGDFLLCRGEVHQGVLVVKPGGSEKEIMPFFFSVKNEPDLDLELSSILDENGELLFEGKTFKFSWADFKPVYEHQGKLRDPAMQWIARAKTEKATLRFIGEVFNHLHYFFGLFSFYQNGLNNREFKQDIFIDENERIVSRLFASTSIVKNKLTQKGENFYQTLVNQEGKEATLEEAQKLFEEIASMKDIPFHHTFDGCYARSHITANWLHEQGWKAGKVWISGLFADPLDPRNHWSYHVATTISIQVDGNSEIRVIDPSPDIQQLLTLEEWFHSMSVPLPPKTVAYPVPEGHYDTLIPVMCFSSHIPYDVCGANPNKKLEETLKSARETNLDTFKQHPTH